MLASLLALSLSLLPGCATLQPASAGAQADQGLFGELEADLKARVSAGVFHGVVATVEVEGQPLLQTVQGLQNRAGQRPMALDTIFRIYSMTKPVTVVAALILMEEGKLALDDPVREYLPAFEALRVGLERAPLEREMTIRNLMCHTSGLTYGIFAQSPVDTLVAKADLLNPDSTLEQMVQKLSALPLKSQPGSSFEYSLSIDVLGRVVEVVSGQSLAEFMQRRIFAPLGMRDTGFFVDPSKLPRLADLNRRAEAGLEPIPEPPGVTRLPRLQSGGGGLFSTTGDYLRFARMLLAGGEHGGTRLLEPGSVALMSSNQMPLLGLGGAYGLGGSVVVQDSGSGPGARTYAWGGLAGTHFWMDPSEGIIGIFMIQNMAESQHSARFQTQVYAAIGR